MPRNIPPRKKPIIVQKSQQSTNVLRDTARGAVSGGVVGAAAGFMNSAIENNQQMAADRRARAFQDEQASKQFHRQRYFDDLEKRWNSEQAQLSRMKMAGLNPNLVYGEMSASTVSTPNSPLASTPNGSVRDFDIQQGAAAGSAVGIDTLYKKAVIDNTNQNTANQLEDTIGKDIENRYKQTGILQTLMEQIERINKIRADAEKSGAETKTIDAIRDSLLEQYSSEIALNKQKVDESKQSVSESQSRVSVNEQNIKESQSRVKVNEQQVRESVERIKKINSEIDVNDTVIRLNNALTNLRDIETKDLLLKYHLDNDQYQLINKYVHDNDLPAGSEKVIIQALENFAQSTGKSIPEMATKVIGSWLDAGNWLNFIAQQRRSDVIEQGNNESVDGTFTPPTSSAPSSGDNLGRNSDKYEQEYDRSYTPNQKRYIEVARQKFSRLNQQKREEYEKWLQKTPYSTQYERAEKIQHLYYQQYGKNTLD